MRVTVTGGFLPTVFFKGSLKKMRFHPKRKGMRFYWEKHIDDCYSDKLREIKRFCRRRFLRCMMIDDNMERSTHYRSDYLKKHRGVFGTGLYFCAYCHSPVRKSKMTVDHIVSVYNARTNIKYRNLLERLGIQNVNAPRNLTASCSKCNARKSSDGGFWIIRGFFGRSMIRVLATEIIELICGGLLLHFLCDFLYANVYSLLMNWFLTYLK